MNALEFKLLGDEIELAYGHSLPAHSRIVGDVPVFGSNGQVGWHDQPSVNGPGIIIGRKGSVGEVTYTSSPFCPIDTTYYVINKNQHDWKYLYYALRYSDLTTLNSHSTIPGLSRENAYALSIYLPSISKQEEIAKVLSFIEACIENQGSSIQLSQDLKHATMHKLFTCGLRGEPQKETEIGLVPESWEPTAIDEIAVKTQYGLSIRGNSDGRYPILRMNCQVDGKVEFRDLQYVDVDDDTFLSFKLNYGDILFNRTNSIEHVGRTALYTHHHDAVFASYLIRLTVDAGKCLPEFINHYMNWPTTQREIKKLASRAVGQANINATKLRTVKVPLPQTLDEQQEIVAILDAIDQKIDLHRRKKTVLEELFKSLLHKLMTGEIRVDDLDLSTLEDMQPQAQGGAA